MAEMILNLKKTFLKCLDKNNLLGDVGIFQKNRNIKLLLENLSFSIRPCVIAY